LAARGLALSIQMIVIAARPTLALQGWREPSDGWWILADSGWERAPEPEWLTLLEQAQLEPPCSEDEQDE